MALSGAAPLRVQAAAAASLLAEGVLPEDVGAAAGLANPAGGEYTPGVLADLADAIRRAAVSAAGALELDGASDATADAAWAEGDESVDYRDSENAPWWDPEALATLLCATHVADGAPGALRASDQAVMARRFVESHGWSTKDVGDLLWCIHTAQHTDTTAHASRGGSGHVVTMARVEELADLALCLSGDGGDLDDEPSASARRATRAIAEAAFFNAASANTSWSRAEAGALFPRALPATDWDAGNGLSGLSAVEGCALLAAALAAGGTAGRSGDGDGDGDSDGFSLGGARAEYPRLSDDRDSRRSEKGWPVSDIAAALRTILDEPAEEPVGGDMDEAREGDEDPAETKPSRREKKPFSDVAAPRGVDGDSSASPSGDDVSSSDASSDASETASRRKKKKKNARRRARFLGGDTNSNVVGTVNAVSRRGVAGRGGGGVARATAPAVGPAALGTKRAPGGGWDAASAARVAASLHGAYGWDVAPCARLAADVLGWESKSPEAAAAAAAAVRHPDVGWNAERAATLVVALAAPFDLEDSSEDDGSWDGSWDVPGFVAPMADTLVGTHGWSPRETAALLEHLQVWCAEDAASLVSGLSEWADAGLAALLGALMEWRHRDRGEVAHVVRALLASREGEWQGGGALGKLLGVREGEARAAAAAEEEESGGESDPEASLRALAAGLTISSRGRRRGGGGGGGDSMPPHTFPPEPVPDGRGLEAGSETIGDGYSADAD